MTTTPTEGVTPGVVAFYDARWKTRWLVTGLVVLLLWRLVDFADDKWLSQLPFWLLVVITGLAPQGFLLIFPILTRSPNRRSTFGVPGPTRWVIEVGIAVAVTIVTIVALALGGYLLSRFSPGSSLTPDAVTDMAKSPDRMYTYVVLMFSFTFAPIAEEVFFRGFLYNALRARMPVFCCRTWASSYLWV
jgi:membrane protease YdiL (CAAX protease family)